MAKKERARRTHDTGEGPVVMIVRMPRDLKGWLSKEAERNGSNRNAEVIRSVRMRADTEKARA